MGIFLPHSVLHDPVTARMLILNFGFGLFNALLERWIFGAPFNGFEKVGVVEVQRAFRQLQFTSAEPFPF